MRLENPTCNVSPWSTPAISFSVCAAISRTASVVTFSLLAIGAVWAKAVEANTASRTMIVKVRMTSSSKFLGVGTRPRFRYAPIVAVAVSLHGPVSPRVLPSPRDH